MSFLDTVAPIVALVGFIAAAVLLIDQWVVSRKAKYQPPAVRISPELLEQFRSEIVHNATKRIVKADFQRGYRR